MQFETGAWIAGILGAVAGGLAARLSGRVFTGAFAWLDSLLGAALGAFLALLVFGVLSILEAWAAFFRRGASPLVPLGFTVVMLALWVTTLWFVKRRRRP